jgi:hypothetical protein
MKLLVISLFESIKEIANVVVVIFFIWYFNNIEQIFI